MNNNDAFWREYTSPSAVLKYSRATAGSGISYLLNHDYLDIYLNALRDLPEVPPAGVRILEFGCGAGMNLVQLMATLQQNGIPVESGVGSDFSPVLIKTAEDEAKQYLREEDRRKVRFCVAKNETLVTDLSAGLGKSPAELKNSFHFILGVNTFRYCHRAQKQWDCAQDILALLVPGGTCVMIDMNDRFPVFRSALKNSFRKKTPDVFIPSLEEYAAPFAKAGFDVVRKEHFCWVAHSSGPIMTAVLRGLTPILNTVAGDRAMRSLVVAKKPRTARAAGA